jgi:DNA polymerase-3 subunit alpha
VSVLDSALQEASLKQVERESGQGSLFGLLDDGASAAATAAGAGASASYSVTLPNVAPFPETERLTREKEILGFYISGHPLEPFRAECELFATHTVSQLGTWQEGTITLGAVVTAIKRQVSKRSGADFARLVIEDFSGSAEILVFPEAWAAIADRVRTDVPLLIKGGYSRRDQGGDNPTFIVEQVKRFEELRISGQIVVSIDLSAETRPPARSGVERRPAAQLAVGSAAGIGVSSGDDTEGDGGVATLAIASESALTPELMEDVRQVVESHPGGAPVEVRWNDGNGTRVRFRSRSLKMAANNAALSELRALLGHERVRLVRGG